MIKKPVFLVGAERSGTTLLRLMLDSHPHIAFHFEFMYAVQLVSDNGTFPPIPAYIQWLYNDRVFRDSRFTIDPSLDFPNLVNSFLRQKQQRDDKELVGATVHYHFDRLLYIWPDARFIHLIRDGRDVARSCVGMGWAGNVWTGVDRWREAEGLWSRFSKRLSPSRYFELRYEEFIRYPEYWLRKICEFLVVPFDKGMFSYAEKSTYDLPDPTLIYQWRKTMSDKDIRLVEAKIGDMLKKRKYDLSGLSNLDVTPDLVKTLLKEDRKTRRLFSINRFGLPLLIMENLTRRLPCKFPNSYFKSRMDKIIRKYIK